DPTIAETDVDCGGACPRCVDGLACNTKDDCQSKRCIDSVCAVHTCSDGEQNGDESSTDCGGSACAGCGAGSHCNVSSDCTTGMECINAVCTPPECNDGRFNGHETSLDCGGPECPFCQPDGVCAAPGDCSTGLCEMGRCKAITLGAVKT